MTVEEYDKKIKALRKERDEHQREANRLLKEMDELTKSLDAEDINWTIGKCIQIDKRSKGGYLEFFLVDSYEHHPRGFTLYGKGFCISDSVIRIESTCTLFIEDGDLNFLKEIDIDKFYSAFDNYVKILREELRNYTNYEKLGDQFLFKNNMVSATLKLKDKNSTSNRLLKILENEQEEK